MRKITAIRTAVLLAGAALSGLCQQGFKPVLVPIGAWALCGTPLANFLPLPPGTCGTETGHEPVLLEVRASSPNTTGYVFVVTGKNQKGEEFRTTGYIPRTDSPDTSASSTVLNIGRTHDTTIMVTEVLPIATQTAQQ